MEKMCSKPDGVIPIAISNNNKRRPLMTTYELLSIKDSDSNGFLNIVKTIDNEILPQARGPVTPFTVSSTVCSAWPQMSFICLP
jgi:hypothetical protein